ncbi:hypothetical protein [Pantoea sp. RIT413]|uniref:hypothetical protein n=1 Tax=Pantoea sp. RIT413 TaxID=2202162 RepID=UPI0011BE1FF8|nr:hypothetical protein [Pantoea sp. RIT 413]
MTISTARDVFQKTVIQPAYMKTDHTLIVPPRFLQSSAGINRSAQTVKRYRSLVMSSGFFLAAEEPVIKNSECEKSVKQNGICLPINILTALFPPLRHFPLI